MMATRYLKALLNSHLLLCMNSQTPGLYVFSKKDEVVPWQAVQHNAKAANQLGLNVQCEVYEESAHIAHMHLDPKQCWASIQDLWQSSCRESHMKAIEAP